jgi:hypothetical protein
MTTKRNAATEPTAELNKEGPATAEANHEPPTPAKKAKRRMSTPLQKMARIEMEMDGLNEIDTGEVVAWFVRRFGPKPAAPEQPDRRGEDPAFPS